MSSITDLMYKEHAIILEGANMVSSFNKLWELDEQEYANNVENLLDFFAGYADTYHHIKEEKVLFPILEETEHAAIIAIINELIEHHQQFRELLGEIRHHLINKNYPEVQKKLNIYIRDLQDHIGAENDELFPMMDSLLNTNELEKLYFNCVDKDNALGLTRKEKFENFIKNFNLNEAVR